MKRLSECDFYKQKIIEKVKKMENPLILLKIYTFINTHLTIKE